MNKAQAENNFFVLHAEFRVDVKPLQNPAEWLPTIISLIRNLCQDFIKQQTEG